MRNGTWRARAHARRDSFALGSHSSLLVTFEGRETSQVPSSWVASASPRQGHVSWDPFPCRPIDAANLWARVRRQLTLDTATCALCTTRQPAVLCWYCASRSQSCRLLSDTCDISVRNSCGGPLRHPCTVRREGMRRHARDPSRRCPSLGTGKAPSCGWEGRARVFPSPWQLRSFGTPGVCPRHSCE